MSGILRWLDDWAEEFCVSVMLALLVLLLGMEVFSRFLLGKSFSWMEELCRYLFVWSSYIGVAIAVKHKEQLRKFYLKNIISDVNFENTKDQKFMDAVSECIQQNITDSSFDVAMLAANLCMSRSNLYNKIKVLTGVSPVEFLRKFRINTAARMLIETDMSVSQIIECVGIESASYFSKVFKQEFGETPSEYQRQRRG